MYIVIYRTLCTVRVTAIINYLLVRLFRGGRETCIRDQDYAFESHVDIAFYNPWKWKIYITDICINIYEERRIAYTLSYIIIRIYSFVGHESCDCKERPRKYRSVKSLGDYSHVHVARRRTTCTTLAPCTLRLGATQTSGEARSASRACRKANVLLSPGIPKRIADDSHLWHILASRDCQEHR